jgi:ATP-dependent DNA helicase RecG
MRNLITEITSLSDIDLLRESVDLECKLALGQDKQGKLPKDFWPSYSALANTDGGLILLGIEEKKASSLLKEYLTLSQFAKNCQTF